MNHTAVFYTYNNSELFEKMDFITTLYHDKKGGQMIRLRKEEEDVTQLSTCDMAELAATGADQASYYTSVNTFKGSKRTSDKIYNYTSMYIDLDCHADDPEMVRTAKEHTVQLLEDAYASGELAVPTMITDTGRGYGIQYVLTKSIANVDRTSHQRAFYAKIRKAIYLRYQVILASDPQAAQADAAVLDDARVCRIPGTYNAKADSMCRLISLSKRYYELSELVQGCHLWDWKSDEDYHKAKADRERQKKERATSGKVVSFTDYKLSFLMQRLEQLRKIQDIRGKACTDSCREQILFIGYSALVQLDKENAPKNLQELNKRFTDPLAQDELDHIVIETDGSIGSDHSGYYKLGNDYLIERLGLTADEIKAVGLGLGAKRAAARQAARQARAEQRDKIIELLKQGDMTYADIAATTGASRRKICMIAKAEGLMRYAGVAARHVTESAKNAIGSVCVGSGSTSPALISTSLSGRDWYTWLVEKASGLPVAAELLVFFGLASSSVVEPALAVAVEDYFDRYMPAVMRSTDGLVLLCNRLSQLYLHSLNLADLRYLWDTCLSAAALPTLWSMYSAACADDTKPHASATQRRMNLGVTDNYAAETIDQRQARLDCYLQKYKDERFAIIERTDEYISRLDPVVLRQAKIMCMQMQRMQRDYLWIEGRKIPTADIKACVADLTYKDIVVICERMSSKGTIYSVDKPFFYIIQTVWKYKHVDVAKAQEDRIRTEKAENKKAGTFNDYIQHEYDFDLDKYINTNAGRRLMGLDTLSVADFKVMVTCA